VQNDEPRRCEVCDKVVFTPWIGVVVNHAETRDIGIVCEECWPSYMDASMVARKVLGSEFAGGVRAK
jgi:hypothetical protein